MTNIKKDNSDLPVISFETPVEWAKWLNENHASSRGIWLRFYKKASGIKTILYAEALDEALCYGWIDGQVKTFDEQSYLQRFTSRRPKSNWSKRNTENIARLEKSGRMRPSGLKEVEAAKTDGRWNKAYDSPTEMEVPDDFLKELAKNKEALAFFESLNKINKYAVAWRLQTAKKPETRARRMKVILEMMGRREKLY
jgi:uncharacterized protein YdeI (YjbR/CyaY-like superfamily)